MLALLGLRRFLQCKTGVTTGCEGGAYVGDVVLAKNDYDPDGALVECIVVDTFVRYDQVVATVSLVNSITGDVLEITGTLEHPFYVIGKGFVALGELQEGDVCVAPDGSEFIISGIVVHEERQTVYNFEVAGAHTYYVGIGIDVAVLVHNQCDPPISGPSVWLYTGNWTAPKSVYEAAMNVAGDSYNTNKGKVHSGLDIIDFIDPTGLANTTSITLLGLEEGDSLWTIGTNIGGYYAFNYVLSKANKLTQTKSALGTHNNFATPQKKIPKSGTAKERSTDAPSWVKGERPNVGENGNDFAKRLMDEKYGPGNWKKGPSSEYDQIRKYGDRGFMDPPPTVPKK